jgi:hypothetical protein
MISLVASWSIEAGSLSDWARVVVVLSLCACLFALLGAAIGALFRGKPRLRVLLCALITSVIFLFLAFRQGLLSLNYSLGQNIASLFEQSAIFVLVYLSPALLASTFVSRWCMRHKTI